MSILSKYAIALLVFFAACSQVNAGTINIGSSENDEWVESVVGYWNNSQTINFSETGTYTMTLKDFKFGDTFDYLGVMVSSSVNTIAKIIISAGELSRQSVTFDIAGGDHWLSVFAITGDKKVGTFGVDFVEGSVAPVPLPPAFIFFATSLLGLVSFLRQKRAVKK